MSLIGGRPRRAQRYLETALKLAEASTDPKDTALLPEIRERLGMLEELERAHGPLRLPLRRRAVRAGAVLR